VGEPSYLLVRWAFLRLLGVVYLVAFLSLGSQLDGLVGSRGILPAQKYMREARAQLDQQGVGLRRYLLLPTLAWVSSSDGFLRALWVAGAVLAVALVAGVAPVPVLVLLWLAYLSLTVIGQDFLSFQWDVLLLEAGLLAILFAPLGWLPVRNGEAQPSLIVLWLLRWLLFRLTMGSGLVKLASGDPNWRHLTALEFHYETQPLPTWIGYWAAHLPAWFQRFSCGTMFVIELGLPLLIFAPRRLRLASCAGMVFLQLLIAATGNYCFFNLLTVTLCVLLLDDSVIARVIPAGVGGSLARVSAGAPAWPVVVLAPLAVVLVAITGVEFLGRFVPVPWPTPLSGLVRAVRPLRSTNTYGLFAVMTTERDEIVVEGSSDGAHWLPYAFKYKPGDVNRRPGFVEPHQPRLDWQMWFAALGDYRSNPWFISFCQRLLEGSHPVLALLRTNPFPHAPPLYVRALLYRYRFTTRAEHRADGAWWSRRLLGDYCPTLELRR
jgi:lipase maturation factor 1